jgi:ribose transport system substrate-binding protein
MKGLDAPYYVETQNTAKRVANELGVNLIFLDAHENMPQQMSDIEDLIAKKCDVIIMDCVEPVGAVNCARAANKAHIPILTINDPVDERATDVKVVTHVAGNHYLLAKMVGLATAKILGNRPFNIVLINGKAGGSVERDRKFGFMDGLTEYQLDTFNVTTFNVIAQGWGDWAFEGGLKAMEDILTAQKKIDIVAVGNDTMGLGALKAIDEAKRLDSIMYVVGLADAQKEALEIIAHDKYKGKYLITGLNWPQDVTKMALESAIKIAKGETVPSVLHQFQEPITKENVAKYYNPNSLF